MTEAHDSGDTEMVIPNVPAGPAPGAAMLESRRDPACVRAWPECRPGGFDPRCCRFPKSCSVEERGTAGALALRDGLAGSDEAIEAILRLIPRQQYVIDPMDDLRRRDKALSIYRIAEPFIAARVRAKAVAEALDLMRAHADDESLNPEALWRQVDRQWGQRYRSDMTAKDRERDEAVARAVAEERQRCADEIRAVAVSKPGLVAGGMEHAAALITLGSTARDIETQRGYIAAGSVPVATPAEPVDDFRSGTCGCQRNEAGDIRCHNCGQYVNVRCWNCRTPRGEGACPSAAEPSVGTGTPAEAPTFEQLLSDPLEQFDRRSELLPAILRHLCSPDVGALLRSIEEYRNAPPAAATTANIHPPRRKLMSLNVEGRHPSTQHFSPLFSFEHLPEGKPRTVSREFRTMAQQMIDALPDGPELTAGLRKLLEAKDCFVRALMLAAIKQ